MVLQRRARTSCKRLGAAAAVLAIAAAAVLAFAARNPAALAQGDAGTYRTWSAIAAAMDGQLAKGGSIYRSGNTAGANAEFAAAYNTIYVAKNFGTVVRDTIGESRQAAQQRQFESIQQLSYMGGNETAIGQRISALCNDLDSASRQLDGNAALAKPDAYAVDLARKIAADRKKLDAAKQKNTGKGDRTWSEVAAEMTPLLDNAYDAYASGDGGKGVDLINRAYYQYYEKLGFEKTVLTAISGNRVSQVEYQFKESRQAIHQGEAKNAAKRYLDDLKTMLVEDAAILDGGAAGSVNPLTQFATSSFGQAFVVLLRDGLEAILIVAALVAYLIKSGNKPLGRYIYVGALAGLAGSGLLAAAFALVIGDAGPQREITEGVVSLLAMLMLLYTSNWMLSKSSADAWNAYIKDKTAEAVSRGSLLSLALVSFLAVFREGAEIVMLYQAIFSMNSGSTTGIWSGFGSAFAVLVLVFLLIRFTSVKIPIKPFFRIASVLMALMVVFFAGGSMHSLITADVLGGTYLPSVPTNDWIGLYPYAESIAAQVVAALAVIALFGIAFVRRRHSGKGLPAATAAHGETRG